MRTPIGKPVIGLNVDIVNWWTMESTVQATYFDAISRAGGIPVLIPPLAKDSIDLALDRLDGFVFIGGLDYSPSTYGRRLKAKKRAELGIEVNNGRREESDIRLMEAALFRQDFPVLGICAGAQLMNIVCGGDLIMDIETSLPESQIVHKSNNGWIEGFNLHKVSLEPDSRLASIYGVDSLDVPTSHHQAVNSIAEGFKVAARADDSIIEAIEIVGNRFCIGVQWHPERDYENSSPLFQEFIRNC